MLFHEVGSGTPIVLLHGFGLDHRSMLPLEPTFDRAGGWRRLYIDLPGATRSPADGIEGTQQVADAVVREVVSRLGSEPFAVLGSSFGGMIARHLAHARRAQVLGLATLVGVFVAPHERRAVPDRTVLRRDERIVPVLDRALEPYRENAVVESVDDARAFLRHDLPGLDGADQAALDRVAQHYALDDEPEDRHPDPFVQPTLHVTGRQDHVVGYSDAWARIEHYPRASFAVLDAAGHNLLAERGGPVSSLVEDWLHRIRQES